MYLSVGFRGWLLSLPNRGGIEIASRNIHYTGSPDKDFRMPSSIIMKFALGSLVAIATGFLAFTSGENLDIAQKWEFEIFASGLTRVDNLAFDENQSLYVSLEETDGQGTIVLIEDNVRSIVAEGLRRPDGLILISDELFITEEVEDGRVMKLNINTAQPEIIAILQKPEGILLLANGDLAITEDLQSGGRLVAVTPDGIVNVLLDNLEKPEGLALANDGTLYLAESGTGRILHVSGSDVSTLIDGLHAPDQIAVATDGSIWITEDRLEGRVLRFSDGQLETIVSGIASPQGIAIEEDGWVYIAEQGLNRIIRLRPRL